MKEVLKLEQGEVIRDETPEEKALQKELHEMRTELEAFKVCVHTVCLGKRSATKKYIESCTPR